MHKDTYIFIQNGLANFDGKIDEPITIKALTENKWNGIYINSKSIEKNISILNYVEISIILTSIIKRSINWRYKSN